MFPTSDLAIHAHCQRRVANEVVKNYDLHHLRRFVKPGNLPHYLKNNFLKNNFSTSITSSNTEYQEEIATPKEQVEDGNRNITEQAQQEALSTGTKEATLYFLICSESHLPPGCALESLIALDKLKHGNPKSGFRTILVPILPPLSVDQARRWSEDYWPTVYKKSNPFGPHPSLVYHAESELHDSAERWMGLAKRAGTEVSVAAIGEPIGAVIVDGTHKQGPSVVVVAGDARWHGVEEQSGNGSGNVLAHAVMRAIGMVANRRRMLLKQVLDAVVDSGTSKFLANEPLTPTEADAYSRDSLPADGYLCFGLDIYVTHEPCAMCSMAILHSRFGRIVFGERLPLTGGIAVESTKTDSHNSGVLNYGLFWRPELNWKLLGWQWQSAQTQLSSSDVHA